MSLVERNWEMFTSYVEDALRQAISGILSNEEIENLKQQGIYDIEEEIAKAAANLADDLQTGFQDELIQEMTTYIPQAIARIRNELAYKEATGA